MSASRPQPDGITPGERRELRSIVKGQFKVLREEVKRREQEMHAEAETQLLDRYRDEDAAIAAAQERTRDVVAEAIQKVREIGRELQDAFPDLTVEAGADRYGGRISLAASNQKRSQLHRAILASIPNKVGDAQLNLSRQEMDLLAKLSVGALETNEAKAYLDTIPTVGELIPAVRLRELEAAIDLPDDLS